MTFPPAIAESVQVTAVPLMLKSGLLPRLPFSTVTPPLGYLHKGFAKIILVIDLRPALCAVST